MKYIFSDEAGSSTDSSVGISTAERGQATLKHLSGEIYAETKVGAGSGCATLL